MAKLKDLIKEHATLGGVVSRPAFSNLDMGFKTQKSTKLKNIVEDMYGEQSPKLNVQEFLVFWVLNPISILENAGRDTTPPNTACSLIKSFSLAILCLLINYKYTLTQFSVF